MSQQFRSFLLSRLFTFGKSLLFTLLFTLLFGGCALLALDGERESSSAERDPVAAAALRYRNTPSSQKEAEGRKRASSRNEKRLVRGMAMEEVLTLWGEPAEVQVAGSPGLGFERWIYFEGLSSPWSLSSGRVVYFERGMVSGWSAMEPGTSLSEARRD